MDRAAASDRVDPAVMFWKLRAEVRIVTRDRSASVQLPRPRTVDLVGRCTLVRPRP